MKNLLLGLSLLFVGLALKAHALPADFEGTVEIGSCSGFLLRPAARSVTQKAWVLTNGHCVTNWLGRMVLRPGQALAASSGARDLSLVTASGTRLELRTQRLRYATMTGTDLAVYELAESYQALEAQGARAFELAAEAPTTGLKVSVFSARKGQRFDCAVDALLVGLREGGFSFSASLRLSDECEQGPGTSGSPLVEAGTRRVVGISNSFNRNGRACGDHNPCEVDADGEVEVFHGARYGQQVVGLGRCLTEGELDLSRAECALTKPSRP